MKTLIFNGSPRKNGDTAKLIEELCARLGGEIKIVHAYSCNISPCIDCRYCHKNSGCSLRDGMPEVYDYLQTCDNVVIASPVYFSELTGPLLSVLSRLQTYWCAKALRKETPIAKPKRGGIILAGGGDGSPGRAADTARCLLRLMNACALGCVVSHNTDVTPARDDPAALQGVRGLALQLGGREDDGLRAVPEALAARAGEGPSANDAAFWQVLDALAASSALVIDRPKGSAHPKYPDMIYPVDYGFLENTRSMDGNGIDVWRGSDHRARLDALICIVDLLKRDSEIKLLIGCTEDEKQTIHRFQNDSEYMKALLMRRPGS